MGHTDFFGREIAVGDHIAFILKDYREFRNGEVLELRNKIAIIKDLDYDGAFPDRMGYGMTSREYSRIIKRF